MFHGVYFVIGDIKGGQKFKANLAAIFAHHAAPAPKVLYLGAACDNDLFLKGAFEKGLNGINPAIEMQSLNLTEHTPLSDVKARPDYIERKFAEADIIFFDGGGIRPLAKTYERFGLAQNIRSAVERGAFAGGLCAGGSYMADQVVFCEDGDVSVRRGAGLIEAMAVSCHMSIADQYQKRAYYLQQSVSSSHASRAIGVSDNQGVVFRDGQVYRLPPVGADTDAPFEMTAQGARTPLPVLA